jgi:hypothetical protein
MLIVWEYRSAEVEFAQGKAIADACKKAEIEFLIWSTLSHATTGTFSPHSQIAYQARNNFNSQRREAAFDTPL